MGILPVVAYYPTSHCTSQSVFQNPKGHCARTMTHLMSDGTYDLVYALFSGSPSTTHSPSPVRTFSERTILSSITFFPSDLTTLPNISVFLLPFYSHCRRGAREESPTLLSGSRLTSSGQQSFTPFHLCIIQPSLENPSIQIRKHFLGNSGPLPFPSLFIAFCIRLW